MRIHLEERPGDILVFLTGQEEIEHACDKLFEVAEKVDYRHDVHYSEVEAMLILPLYGSMTTGLYCLVQWFATLFEQSNWFLKKLCCGNSRQEEH